MTPQMKLKPTPAIDSDLVITAAQFETLSPQDKRVILASTSDDNGHSRFVRNTQYTLAIYHRLRTQQKFVEVELASIPPNLSTQDRDVLKTNYDRTASSETMYRFKDTPEVRRALGMGAE